MSIGISNTNYMKNVYLFQPQYSTASPEGLECWLPYSAGCVWSYAAQFEDISTNFQLCDLFFQKESIELVLQKITEPAVCGFSCYIWNHNYCMAVAEAIKHQWPNCLIIFGGPQVNGKLLKHKFIDSIVTGEGEENFVNALRNIIHQHPTELIYSKQRLEQLNVPSPYTTGVFDKIVTDNPTITWSMTFETNRGCPYQCTFCDWGSLIYSKVKKFDLDHVRQDLEWAIGKPVNYVYCADANFGIFKERDLEIAKIIRKVADQCNFDTVNLIYAKNSSDIVFQIAQILGDLNRGITVSVQSENPDTLDAIKRKNLESNNIKKLMDLSNKYDIPTYTEVILGLPLETIDTWKSGLAHVLELGQHNSIDVWLTQLIENSELNSADSRLKYSITSVIARDYMPRSDGQFNLEPIVEEFEIINSTNTMTTNDMVEGYMWAWMIVQFHITGYTQILAKYCRYIHNISYLDFYQHLFTQIKEHAVFKQHYATINGVVEKYLYQGVIDQGVAGHAIHAMSYQYLYNNKELVYQLGQQLAESLKVSDLQISEFQSCFIFNSETTYPFDITLNYDISTWQQQTTCYRIESRLLGVQDYNFYRNRRQGQLKNKITKLS